MDGTLILSRVARVMRTMSSWRRSWGVVPVRWGSYRRARQIRWSALLQFLDMVAGTLGEGAVSRILTLVVSLSTRDPTRPPSALIVEDDIGREHPCLACLDQHALALAWARAWVVVRDGVGQSFVGVEGEGEQVVPGRMRLAAGTRAAMQVVHRLGEAKLSRAPRKARKGRGVFFCLAGAMVCAVSGSPTVSGSGSTWATWALLS